MRRNFLKFCFISLGSVALLSACVEADNLDSIEQLQDVTAKAKLDEAKTKEASNRQALADKIYTLQTNVATLKGDILALEASENQIEFLSADYELQVERQNIELSAAQDLLQVLIKAEAAGNYQAAIDSVSALLEVSRADYEAKNLVYQKAVGASNTAYEVYNNAASAYNRAVNALSGYKSIEDLQLAVNSTKAEITAQENIVSQWSTSERAALQVKTAASADRDLKYADYLKKQAVVDNAQLDGGTASSAQITARDNAYTAYTVSDNAYWDSYYAYNEAANELKDAQSTLANLQEDLVYQNQDLIDAANISALKTTKETKYAEYLVLDGKTGTASAARNAADNIASEQENLLDDLSTMKYNLKTAVIYQNEDISALEASIQANNDKIAQLAGGFNTNTSKLVVEWIAAANAKIAAYEAIIASYKI